MARALILARNVLLSDWPRPERTASFSAYLSRYRLANGFSFFGVDKPNSLGILHMRLPTPNDSFIMLEVDAS
jgi:hypothetical protein